MLNTPLMQRRSRKDIATMTNIMIIYFLTTCCILKEAFSLQLTKVVIPPYKFHGETALLECQYELNSNKNHNNRNHHSRYNNNKDYGYRSIHSSISDDNNGIDHLHNGGGNSHSRSTTSDEEETLYSVKWYKDNEEFYRYVPGQNPAQQSYKVEGIRVDHQSSNDVKVMLKRLNLKSSGIYRCEVSAEAPNFSSVEDEGRMEVVYLPRDGPQISGEKSQYQIGDTLNINCTSGKSHPSSSIQWFINDEPVYDSTVIAYPPTVHQHGLVTTALGLHMLLDSSHFDNGLMRIKCLTSVSPLIAMHSSSSSISSSEGNAAEARESAYTNGNGNGNSNSNINSNRKTTNYGQRKPPLTDSREVLLVVRNTATEHRAVSKTMAFSLVMLLILFKQFLV